MIFPAVPPVGTPVSGLCLNCDLLLDWHVNVAFLAQDGPNILATAELLSHPLDWLLMDDYLTTNAALRSHLKNWFPQKTERATAEQESVSA